MSRKEEIFAGGGLDELLNRSENANRYFSSLPDYVRDMIMQRRQNVHTEDELRRYSDNLMQGDK